MPFQGTPLGGGQSVGDVVIGSWLVRCCGRPIRGGCACELDKWFTVDGGVKLGSPRYCCLVYLLESILLRSIRLHLTSAGSPVRYRIFKPG